MNIIKALNADLPAILTLQKLCYQESGKRYNDFTIPPLIQTIEELESEFQNVIILIAIINDTIIGSVRAYMEKGTCYIGRLIVHPDFQNRGIGKALMRDIEKQFPGIKRFELFTGFRDEKNLYFYKSLGYKPFKEEKKSETLTLVFLEKVKK
jgi:GNAT superfamily N-acetyltransferase